MKVIGENIWVQDDVMLLAGLPLRIRMTLIRLTSGLLWVHSPTPLNDKLRSFINTLGKVGYIVGASNGHNLWINEWRHAYSEAEVIVSDGIPKKIGLDKYKLVKDVDSGLWQDDIEMQHMPSVPFFCETVFYHKLTRSLIVTDMIQNTADEPTESVKAAVMKFIFTCLGFKGLGVAPPLRWGFTIKDKRAFSRFIESIKMWEFDSIVVAHGEIITDSAKEKFSELTARFIN